MYVRQHYNLATTGKLGQKAGGKGSAGSKASHGKTMKKGGGYRSQGSKGASRA